MIEEESDVTFVEFQNALPFMPAIEERSAEYYAHGIIKCRGKKANQVWILAEGAESLLKGEGIKRYVLKDEASEYLHPVESGIMYVDLKGLAGKSGPAGELAAFLLGAGARPASGDVRKIVRLVKKCFSKFRTEKEVSKMLTLRERALEEGEARGIALGEARGIATGESRGEAKKAEEVAKKLDELQQLGLDASEILRALSATRRLGFRG